VTGRAVLAKEVLIDAAEGFSDKALFRRPSGHPLLEDAAVTAVTTDATATTHRRIRQQQLSIPMTGDAGYPLVGAADGHLMADGAVLSGRRQNREQKQPQGDADSFPAGHSRVPSDR
jgi:hypothetical protein